MNFSRDIFGTPEKSGGPWEDFLVHGLDDAFGYNILHSCESGSRVICNPPVLNTDHDYLVLVDDLDRAGMFFSVYKWDNCLYDWLDKEGTDSDKLDFSGYGVELDTGARFQAWRKEEVNVILTDDETLHLRSVAATLLAKELNLKEKEQRIKLFRCIKLGEKYGGRYQ